MCDIVVLGKFYIWCISFIFSMLCNGILVFKPITIKIKINQ